MTDFLQEQFGLGMCLKFISQDNFIATIFQFGCDRKVVFENLPQLSHDVIIFRLTKMHFNLGLHAVK